MSEERTIQLRFADDGERQRYAALREQPGLHDVMSMGANLATDHLLPRIADGRATYRPGELDRQIAGFLKAGCGDVRTQFGRPMTDDESFMFRIGYEGVALAARDAHQQAQVERAGEKLGEGLALAGIASCNEGLKLLGEPELPTFLAPPGGHLLSEAPKPRRSLRPEDFGCLPTPPR